MSADAVTLADITSADWSLKLGAVGQVVQGLADVEQCLRIICTTPKGSDPLRPTFGCDLASFIDLPANLAVAILVRELTDAITQWEPRVNLISIAVTAVTPSAQPLAQYQVAVTWQLKIAAAATPPTTTVLPTIGSVGGINSGQVL